MKHLLKFQKIYLEVVEPNTDKIISVWNNSKNFTQIMVNGNNSIIRQIADKLHLKCKTEYWSIDAVLYEKTHDQYYNKNSIFAQYLNIAIEHENNANTAHEEINKLSLFNAPLKVLITYSNILSRTERLLGDFADIIKKADIFSDFSSLKKQLVIIGYIKRKKLNWDFYIYKDKGFIPL